MSGFQDIIGQNQIKQHLQNAIENHKVSHAYIIQGERFSGKEFIARIFARTLQCEKKEKEPCETCHSCLQALSDNHPDIIYVQHEKPASIGVEEIREQVANDIDIKPYSSDYKIYIIQEAEKMTVAAQNALLKTLEEPPAYAVIILLATSVETLLPTIQSRCVTLSMQPVPTEELKSYLMKEMQIPDYQADICVAFARGNLGRAKMLAASDEFNNIRREALSLVHNIKKMTMPEIMQRVKNVESYKVQVEDFLDVLSVWYRDVLLFKATNDVNHLIFRDEIQHITAASDNSAYEGIETILDALETAKVRLKANVKFELVMELLFITIQDN